MIIKQNSIEILKELLSKKKIIAENLNSEVIEELNLSGIIRFVTPAEIELTYAGEMIANILNKISTDVERVVGSEIIAMISEAKRNDNKTTK